MAQCWHEIASVLLDDVKKEKARQYRIRLNICIYTVAMIALTNWFIIIYLTVNYDPLYIKGKISKCNTIVPLWKTGTCINYGIESYYVKEHTGKDLEKNLRDGALVKISIDRQGNAKVKEFIENKSIQQVHIVHTQKRIDKLDKTIKDTFESGMYKFSQSLQKNIEEWEFERRKLILEEQEVIKTTKTFCK